MLINVSYKSSYSLRTTDVNEIKTLALCFPLRTDKRNQIFLSSEILYTSQKIKEIFL